MAIHILFHFNYDMHSVFFFESKFFTTAAFDDTLLRQSSHKVT